MQGDIWEEITDHYETPFHQGTITGATHRYELHNKSCGDSVSLQLRVENDYVMEAWFDGDGCCVSQASASILVQSIEGKTLEQIRSITAEQWIGRFKGIGTPKKRQCVLLAWQVLQGCIQ